VLCFSCSRRFSPPPSRRSRRSSFIGAGTATLALAAVIAALGLALALIPIDALRIVVGTLLLIFGLQWLRKAILRAGHYKAYRDEAALYQKELAEARATGTPVRTAIDWYAFTLAFKGVFLEGLEVAFIVLTFGTSQGSIPLAAARTVADILGHSSPDFTLRQYAHSFEEVRQRAVADVGTLLRDEGRVLELPLSKVKPS
jgi:uncharacterized membrane protein